MSRSTERWIGCSKPLMPKPAMSSGSFARAPASSDSRFHIAARMDSNTSRFCPALAARPAVSQMREVTLGCVTAPWGLRGPRRTFLSIPPGEANCSYSNSLAQIPRRTTPPPARTRKAITMRHLANAAALTAILALVLAQPGAAQPAAPDELRVCADPNNLPFSNSAKEGFEDKVADLLAQKLGKRLSYVWWAQRRGFVRHTLNAGQCELVMGVPVGYGH